jgi:hypothetical protein
MENKDRYMEIHGDDIAEYNARMYFEAEPKQATLEVALSLVKGVAEGELTVIAFLKKDKELPDKDSDVLVLKHGEQMVHVFIHNIEEIGDAFTIHLGRVLSKNINYEL